MMLADTSVWIDFLSGNDNPKTILLSRALSEDRVYIGDLIVTEVLQGIRRDAEVGNVAKIFDTMDMVDLCGAERAEKAAQNYRHLRKLGITVRSTIDVIIATWCIENDCVLLHNDRDFLAMEEHLGLIAA